MTNNNNKRQNMEFNGYNFKAEWNISNFQDNNPEYYSPLFVGDNFEIKLTLHQNISNNNDTPSISFEIISIPSDAYLTYYLIISNKDSKRSIRINDNEIIAAGKEEIQVPIQIKSHDITPESGYLQNGSLQICIFFKQETFIPQPENLVNNSTDWFINTIISDFHNTLDPIELTINDKLLKFALIFEKNEKETYNFTVFLIDQEISFDGELEVNLNNHKSSSHTITKSERIKFDADQTDIDSFTFDLKTEDFNNPENGWIVYDDQTKDVKTGLHFTITFRQSENNEEGIEKDAIIEKLPTIKIKNVKYLKSERPLSVNVDECGFFNIDMRYPKDSDFQHPIYSRFYHAGEIVIQFILDLSQQKLLLRMIESLSNENDIDVIFIFFNSDPSHSDLHKFVLHYSSSDEEFSFNVPFSINDLNDEKKGWIVNNNLNIRFQIDGSHFDRQWIDNYTYPIFENDKDGGFFGWEFFVPTSLFDKNNNLVMLNPIVIDVLSISVSLRYEIDQTTNKLIIKPTMKVKTHDYSVLHLFVTIENNNPQKCLSYMFIDISTTVKDLPIINPRKSFEEDGFIFKSDSYDENIKISIRLYYTGIISNLSTGSAKLENKNLSEISSYLAAHDNDSSDNSDTDKEQNKQDIENDSSDDSDADKEQKKKQKKRKRKIVKKKSRAKKKAKSKKKVKDEKSDTDKNIDSDKNSDSDKDTDTNKNSDAVKDNDTNKNSDAIKDTDTDKYSDAVKDTDTDKNSDAVNDTDKYSDNDKNSDTDKNSDNDKNSDTDKNSEADNDKGDNKVKKRIRKIKKIRARSSLKKLKKKKSKKIAKKEVPTKEEEVSNKKDIRTILNESQDDNNENKLLNSSGAGYVGLINQGATCYLNSLLQTLFHLPAFRKIIYEIPTTGNEDDDELISLNLQRLFYKMQFENNPCSTAELTNSFNWTSEDVGVQRDIEEYLRILISHVEDTMKGTEQEDLIANLLRGTFRKCINCINVDYQSVKEETFYDLSMDVKGISNLYESFENYVKPDELNGTNKYDTTSEIYGKQDAIMQTKFVEFPPVLHVKLNRIIYDSRLNKMVKINDRFEFPTSIDLTDYLTDDSPSRLKSNLYDLYGVVVHSGSADGGHYYAFLRTSTSPNWYQFNDKEISKASEYNAVNDNYGNIVYYDEDDDSIKQKKINYSAYLLVYIRSDDAESLFQPIKDESIPNHLKHFNDLIKIQFAHENILKKNSINRINGFFPPNSIQKYNDKLYHE